MFIRKSVVGGQKPNRLLVLLVISASFCEARDLTTTAGETFYDVHVTRTDACGIGITHRYGVVFLNFSKLSTELRREFGYSEQAYANCKIEENRRYQAYLDQQQELAAQAAASKSTAQTVEPARTNASVLPDYSSRDYSALRYIRDYSTRSFGGQVDVRGYFRKDGTYVHPYTRRYPHSR